MLAVNLKSTDRGHRTGWRWHGSVTSWAHFLPLSDSKCCFWSGGGLSPRSHRHFLALHTSLYVSRRPTTSWSNIDQVERGRKGTYFIQSFRWHFRRAGHASFWAWVPFLQMHASGSTVVSLSTAPVLFRVACGEGGGGEERWGQVLNQMTWTCFFFFSLLSNDSLLL